MKRMLCLLLIILLLGTFAIPACADAIVPDEAITDTPIDKMGELGGPLLIIFMLLVLPLALICGLFALTVYLIKKVAKALKKKK